MLTRSRYFGAGLQRETERLEAQAVAFSEELSTEARILKLRPGTRVLDAGCGSGAVTRRIAELVAPSVVIGVDIDSTFVSAAKKESERLSVSNTEFRDQDLTKLEFDDGTFDLTYCRFVLPFTVSPLKALRELKRVTRPEGRVAVVEFEGMFAFHEPKLGLEASGKIAKYLNRGKTRWRSDYDTLALMKRAGLRMVEAHPIPEFASQANPKRLRELLTPVFMQQVIYGKAAVKAMFLSRRELLQGKRDLERFLAHPESFWMALTMLRLGTV